MKQTESTVCTDAALKWLLSLKIKDKIDVFDDHRYENKWKVATILNILKTTSTQFEFYIHYDGSN